MWARRGSSAGQNHCLWGLWGTALVAALTAWQAWMVWGRLAEMRGAGGGGACAGDLAGVCLAAVLLGSPWLVRRVVLRWQRTLGRDAPLWLHVTLGVTSLLVAWAPFWLLMLWPWRL